MSSSIPGISAIHCIRTQTPAPSTQQLTDWTIESHDSYSKAAKSKHPHFNPQSGLYTVPKDGIYLLTVQIIPIGGAILSNAHQTRKQVHYAVHVQHSLNHDEYFDIGGRNLGHLQHLRAGTKISCVRMTGANARDCIRLSICCVQRKRKRMEKTVLSKKEIERKKRANRVARRIKAVGNDDDVEDSSDTEWEHGFESYSTSDELATSTQNINRLSQRLKKMDVG